MADTQAGSCLIDVRGVQSPSGDHCCCRGGPLARQRSPSPTAWLARGCTSSWPATGPRATRRSSPLTTPEDLTRALEPATVELIVQTRRDLAATGLDAGPDTIAWDLEHHHRLSVGTTTIHRYLHRAGLVTPEPHKRPRSSYIRFEADQPNETWQADFTHYRLADGDDSEILSWLDDHARYALSITAHLRVTGPIVVDTFRAAVDRTAHPHRR